MHWRHLALPIDTTGTASYLPFGNGRSYGDSCLNQAGYLIDARGLDRFIDFDPDNGVIRCEAGVLLSIILDKVIPSGWFLPVVPGTQLVTVGGAIANDVHGKNHHRAGTFGCHVRCFELLRSDGERLLCSPEENPEWYHASIGGLGLTGLITWAELTLKKISSRHLIQSHQKFSALDTFFELSESSDQVYEYTVAWIDCLAKSARGIFFSCQSCRGNHRSGKTAAIGFATVVAAAIDHQSGQRHVVQLALLPKDATKRGNTDLLSAFLFSARCYPRLASYLWAKRFSAVSMRGAAGRRKSSDRRHHAGGAHRSSTLLSWRVESLRGALFRWHAVFSPPEYNPGVGFSQS